MWRASFRKLRCLSARVGRDDNEVGRPLEIVIETKRLDPPKVGQYPVQVKSITYSAARENLASTINRVCEDQAPVVITRNRDQAVVMLSLAEYESLQETAYLLRSPANARRLLESLEAAKRGKLVRKKLKLDA
jgi:antitoxin YefM